MSLYRASKLIPSSRYSTMMKPWIKQGQVLDVSGGEWDSTHVTAPSVIKDTDYKMWYTGYSPGKIGYATSGDGINWTKSGSNPVLDIGTGGSWDDVAVTKASVIKDTDYKMWYVGYDGSNRKIGYATSSDGIAWTKSGSNPVLTLGTGGSWDDVNVHEPTLIRDKNIYKIWYVGYNGSNDRIGYASSGDGIAWTKSGSNPVLDLGTGGQWDDNNIDHPFVMKDGIYKMWYAGDDSTNYRIGYATSGDGIVWTKDTNNPVVTLGSGWESNGVNNECVIKDGLYYKMYYSGTTGSNYTIGLATSY